MIITYMRSSSFNTWDFCPHQYFLDYGLGFRAPANKKAEKGTITHKSLELLARMKLAQQNGQKSFTDDEIGKTWQIKKFTKDKAAKEAFIFYTKTKDTIYDWLPVDEEDCKEWMHLALELSEGIFSPLNRTIVAPEQFFDFVIEKPEFWYSYDFNGQKIEGYMGLKGTVDLTVEVPNHKNTIELIDWKTGSTRKDWAKGYIKEYPHLRNDPQLRIYHYALCQVFPDAEQILMTIVFMRAGGAYTLAFSRDKDLPETEKILEKRFHTIKNCTKPRLIYPNWKCDRLCHYGKNLWEPDNKDSQTICHFIRDEIVELGMDKVINKHGEIDKIVGYGSGGGKTHDNPRPESDN